MNEIVIIPEVIKQFQDEWVAFEVYEEDIRKHPYKGRLLAHSKNRDEVWEVVHKLNPQDCLVEFTGEIPPKGMKFIL